MEEFKGKTIYNPSGKAGEYSYWACNFYVGCSVGCEYCYLRKGRGAKILGGDTPKLKSCFKSEAHALEVFVKEAKQNITELQRHGLFFSFTTDPMLKETLGLTNGATGFCTHNQIPVKILTKCTEWVDEFLSDGNIASSYLRKYYAFGFTLTGHDELEPNASTNAERINAMKKLYDAGFKTFASIEPIVDIESSAKMIKETYGYCDLYKIGLMSGQKYAWQNLRSLMLMCYRHIEAKFYFKDSFLKQAGIERSNLPNNCVNRDYNLFIKEVQP
ncbi:hypothetical protein G7050_02850 [Dysgonomonas sp. HDW5A]|uniref:hypothetical protein n=1 Tax=Dysgonomonas sp. HDW5A TaxID=2714926 RepID=UPI00140A27B4|nr:hypothetical protein [Dysgonomonas sp. HDW5A]QIK58835.1 hypothetical protein G7050_02850 [Dysgonomonas sp. HDW5A]